MIWADMFWRTDTWSTGSLPPETILVDWQYGGSGPWPSLARLRNTDHDVWGASAIRSGFDAKYALAPLGMRLENVLGWNRLRARGEVSHIMHTVWGRGDSLRPIYGPWEGWLPGFLAGAEAMAWSRHPLATLCTDVDRAMIDPEWIDPQPLMERLQSFQSDDAMVRDCVSWWVLALRHRRILQGAVEVVIGHAGYEAVTPRRGVDPQRTADRKAARERWRAATAEWRLEAAGWLAEHLYSETEEYLAVKLDGIERCLE